MIEDPLAKKVGIRTVGENLAAAVAAGDLTVEADGRWRLFDEVRSSWYLPVKYALPLQCRFLNDFLFRHAYAAAAVPFGCRACFKVKVAPRDFRGLIALRGILEQAPYHSKCGIDFFNKYSQDAYAGYLYLESLESARAAWRDMRDRVDAHPALGPGVRLTIKRGCSNYEDACGPSDRWQFDEGLAAIETDLAARFYPVPAVAPDYRRQRAIKMVEWLQIAFNLGDETYRDFTGGRPLHPATVSYAPSPESRQTTGDTPPSRP